MKIGIDARKLSSNKSGIGYYAYNLIRSALEQDCNNEYILYSDKTIGVSFNNSNCKIKILPMRMQSAKYDKLMSPYWQNFILTREMKKDGVDLFFSPNFFKPLLFRKPSIVTVHDLTFFTVPEAFSGLQRLYNKIFLRMSLSKRVKVLTVSECSKKDIQHYYHVKEQNIFITYCAVDDKRFKPISELDSDKNMEVKQKYCLPERFILFVGTIEPRKNVSAILESLKKIKDNKNLAYKFVICGSRGMDFEKVKHTVKDLGLDNDVHFSGYVEDEDLPYIYANAELFVYPSIYEGFGIPPLEAMASEVPTITSDLSSLPEVVGEAACLVDPRNVQQLADSIEQMMNNYEVRESFIHAGKIRVKRFSWDESAATFLKVVNFGGWT